MVLSRFFVIVVTASIAWAVLVMLWGRSFSLYPLVNGRQGDPIIAGTKELSSVSNDSLWLSRLQAAGTAGFWHNDTLWRINVAGQIEYATQRQAADGLLPTCKHTVTDIWLPLIGYLTFFCGLMNLLTDSRATERISRLLAPFFTRIFPDLPKDHPAFGFMTMNFAANFLGLDNAATPFGLKAMQCMQETNPNKDRATNSQIMFLTLHAAGLTLIPTSLIGYRAALQAQNPTDIMLPLIITSFIGTVAALIIVGLWQRINLLNGVVVGVIGTLTLLIGGLLWFLSQVSAAEKLLITTNLSNGLLLMVILAIVGYAWYKESHFWDQKTTIFDSFVEGAKEGFTVGLRILPYMIAMLGAISLFRNSGLMDVLMQGVTTVMRAVGVNESITQALPVALMRPFSAGGARGFMLDAMKTYGPDSLTGQLATLFQGAAETTFYVVAIYFGAVHVRNTRYTIGAMLLVDLICVITAIVVAHFYFVH